MDHIAKEAHVTKLTVYNHFQDKANLFSCAIEETCEKLMLGRSEPYRVCRRLFYLS